jgi:hypothetical protein
MMKETSGWKEAGEGRQMDGGFLTPNTNMTCHSHSYPGLFLVKSER